MTARVLVVDDMPANVKLLEARLQAEYFETVSAFSGEDALGICERERIDVVLLDVMMPGMDGFEVCQRIKKQPSTQDVPVIMVTALDQPQDKLHGLEAGADDFLTKPVDDIALITRVKNLARLKVLNDEMKLRASTGDQLGLSSVSPDKSLQHGVDGRVLVVEDQLRAGNRIVRALEPLHAASVETDTTAALEALLDGAFDVAVVSLNLSNVDALRLCSQLRSHETTRHLPIIMLVDSGDEARLLRGLDLGVNDYLMRPIDRSEMLARVRTQVRRKRHSDFLRNRLVKSVELSVIDPLTGLHNRRYLESHLETLIARAFQTNGHLAVVVTDIDHFKSINDTYGHDAGDRILQQFSERLKQNTRGADLACRFGGEEFVLVLPDSNLEAAYQIAERMRADIAAQPFEIDNQTRVPITTSLGLAILEFDDDTPASLFKRADNALYVAKQAGRNRVMADAA